MYSATFSKHREIDEANPGPDDFRRMGERVAFARSEFLSYYTVRHGWPGLNADQIEDCQFWAGEWLELKARLWAMKRAGSARMAEAA